MERRSAILIVPSYVARIERNIVINPAHVEAGDIETSLPNGMVGRRTASDR